MKNWMQQDIVPGMTVYRGARDGTTSSFKIGVVESVSGQKARVAWLFSAGWKWINIAGEKRLFNTPSRPYNFNKNKPNKGNPGIDSLVPVVVDLIELERQMEAYKSLDDQAYFNSEDDLMAYVASFIMPDEMSYI